MTCEFHNIAAENQQVADRLWRRIQQLNATATKPANVPLDPRSWPVHHHYQWSIWK